MTKPVALITGATRGIGEAIAAALAPDYHLVLGGSTAESAARAAAKYPDAEPFVADLNDVGSIAGAVAGLSLERLDVLVHCAGVVAHGSVIDTPAEEWQRAFNVNFFAVAELTRALLPALDAAYAPDGPLPAVVAINSGAGYHAGPGWGPYATTKFALRAYTDTLREEHRERLRVVSIHPGKTDSDMQRDIQAHRGNAYNEADFMNPASVASTVQFALSVPRDAMVENLTIRPASGR